jgi:hypothetical protein
MGSRNEMIGLVQIQMHIMDCLFLYVAITYFFFQSISFSCHGTILRSVDLLTPL